MEKVNMIPDQGENTGVAVMPDGPINPSAFTPSEPVDSDAYDEEVHGVIPEAPEVEESTLASPDDYDPVIHGKVASTSPVVAEDPDLVNDSIEKVRKYFGRIEGTRPHVGADAQNLTLPFGIVPDSVMVNGVEVRAGANTLSNRVLENNPDQVQLMTATKTVGNTTYRASDYNSYVEFADAVLGAFEQELVSTMPDLPEEALPTMLSSMWNAGVGSGMQNWSGFQATVAELKKPEGSRNMHDLVAMGKHSFTGGKSSVGLLKRRMEDLNLSLPPSEQIAKVDQRTINGKPVMRVFDRDGNVIRTFNFNKASINNDQEINLEIDPLDEVQTESTLVDLDAERSELPTGEGETAPQPKPEPTPLSDGIYEDPDTGKPFRMQGGRMYDLRTGERLDVDPVQDTGPDVGTIRAGQSAVGEINAMVNPLQPERQATLGDQFAGSGNASLEGTATFLKEVTGANLGPNVMAALDAGDTQGAVLEAALEILPPGLEELMRSMFVGVRSAAATDRVNKAIKMDEAGASVDEIKQATNMHRGPEGLWRDEISDAASVVKPEVEFLPEIKPSIDMMGQTRFANKNAMPALPDIFTHDELYNLYPELRDIKIAFLREGDTANGTMFLSEGVLAIHPRLLREGGDAARIKILHEIQHQVQMYEGFIGGGGVAKSAQRNWSQAKKNIRLAPQDYPSLKDFGETAWMNVGQKLNAGENVDDLIKNLSPDAQAYVKSNAGRWARRKQELVDAYDDYLRIHGEAEARITEKSVNMSTAERAGSNPYDRDYRNPVKDKQFKDTKGRNL